MKNKCPKCKSKNIIDQRWLYPLSPNECNDCGLKWEPTVFLRVFLSAWISILVLSVITGAIKNEFFKSDFGVVVVFSFLTLLFIAPAINWYIHPYKVWGGSDILRKAVNFGCIGSIVLVAVLYYANA